MIASFLFYMFAMVLVGSAIATVTVRQPVTAVLCMILCFFNAAGLFLFLGAEFLAFILLIVYVGAVAVLFLFVVMMLDVKAEKLVESKMALQRYVPVGLGLGAVLLLQMMIVAGTWPAPEALGPQMVSEQVTNTRGLGQVLYTDYALLFQMAGLILLTAMIGAIVLTLRTRRSAKRQNYMDQLDIRRDDVVQIRKVKTGEGVL